MVAENGGVEPHTIQYSLFSRQDRRPRLVILQKIKTPDSAEKLTQISEKLSETYKAENCAGKYAQIFNADVI